MNLPPSAPKMPSGMCSQAKREWKRIVPLLLDLGTVIQVYDSRRVGLLSYLRSHSSLVQWMFAQPDAFGG